MMKYEELIEVLEYGSQTLMSKDGLTKVVIQNDECYENPREWSEYDAVMFCRHSRYKLGDKELPCAGDLEDWHNEEQDLEEDDDHEDFDLMYAVQKYVAGELDCPFDHVVMLPLYLYDHSGLSMNTSGFACSWDSGMVGVIAVDVRKYDDKNQAEESMKSQVKEYDCYLRGEIYMGIVYRGEECNLGHTHWEEIDACTGFIGYDHGESGLAEWIYGDYVFGSNNMGGELEKAS
jgi:hypothetical protein